MSTRRPSPRVHQLAELQADPDRLVPLAVEEICRYHTGSSFALRRVAKRDTKINGQVRACVGACSWATGVERWGPGGKV